MIERATQGWRPYALLALLALGLYLPGMASLPVTDRDEARFAQATRQMLESRDFIAIRFLDEARNKKPAGIYWLQAASVAVFSDAESTAIWPYRLPSLLGAMGAGLMSFGMGAALVGRRAAFLGAALLTASLGLVTEAHLAKTDAVLLATIAAAELALGQIYLAARGGRIASWYQAAIFWLAMAAGILIKGPVAPLVAILTIAALVAADRDGRWLKGLHPLWGLLGLVAIVTPWLVAIMSATQGTFLSDSLGNDFLAKLIGAQEAHGAPPLYYLALLPVTFWPGTLFLGPAIAWAWRRRAEPAQRFLIAWAVPFWLVLELVPTKLPNYLLPVFPALALLAGSALIAAGESDFTSWRWLDRATAGLGGLVTLGIGVALVAAPFKYGDRLSAAGLAAAIVALSLGLRCAGTAWRKSTPNLAIRAAILALLILPLGFEFVAPSLDRLWLSRAVAELVAHYGIPKDASVAATGYAEPSLVFLLGSNTKIGGVDRAAQNMTMARGALALVASTDDAAFHAALGALGWEPREVGKVEGLDYSNGRNLALTLYDAVPR
jgi:4-amino-4-deoxy-L-arabinose transferase-like glycosyltransferase